MDDDKSDINDSGLSVDALWTIAWLLGLCSLGTVIRLATYAADGIRVQAELFVWVLVGAVTAVFSASSSILAGVKSAEQRLSRQSGTPKP